MIQLVLRALLTGKNLIAPSDAFFSRLKRNQQTEREREREREREMQLRVAQSNFASLRIIRSKGTRIIIVKMITLFFKYRCITRIILPQTESSRTKLVAIIKILTTKDDRRTSYLHLVVTTGASATLWEMITARSNMLHAVIRSVNKKRR